MNAHAKPVVGQLSALCTLRIQAQSDAGQEGNHRPAACLSASIREFAGRQASQGAHEEGRALMTRPYGLRDVQMHMLWRSDVDVAGRNVGLEDTLVQVYVPLELILDEVEVRLAVGT